MFKKSTFKKVFKEAISTDLLTSMLIALRDHSTIQDAVNTFEVTISLATHSLRR